MRTKECTSCHEPKPIAKFYKQKSTKDGLMYECKMCNSSSSKTYLRSKNGLIIQIYSAQKTRSKRDNHPMPTYTKQELKSWMFNQEIFHKLFDYWVEFGYDKWLKPSCDRTDDYKGYSLDRLQIMTWRENFDKAHTDKINGINNKGNKAVSQFAKDGKFIKEYYSISQAHRETNIDLTTISCCCRNIKYKTAGGYKWKFKEA